MIKLTLKVKVYLVAIYIITIVSLMISIKANLVTLKIGGEIHKILFFSVLTAATESCTMSYNNVSFSITFIIIIATYTLFGPLISSLILVIGYSFKVLKTASGKYKNILNTPIHYTIFNYCTILFPIYIGNYVFFLLSGKVNCIVRIIVFGISNSFVNGLLTSIMEGLSLNKNIINCLFKRFRLIMINMIIMLPLGIYLKYIFEKHGYEGVILLIFPLIILRYTFVLYNNSKYQYIQMVDVLMRAIEARDKYTEGHSQRVAEISIEIAKALKYNNRKIKKLNMAAMLHDVGKIGIEDSILNKAGNLTDEEYMIIKKHPDIGFNILKDINNLQEALDIVIHHHERYDGKGYPEGKAGEELSLDVYIIQLADSVDAMASDRPYRKALELEKIISEIKSNSGTQFHPKVVNAYLRILENRK